MTLPTRIRRQRLAGLAGLHAEVLAALVQDRAVERLWAFDHTLWSEDPTEISDRLGWLPVIDEVTSDRDRIDGLAATVAAAGFDRILVMGMGGSSLFPEVLASTAAANGPPLVVLDSTDPAAVAAVGSGDLTRTLFVASSKSGSTIETRSHLDYFWDRVSAPEQFVLITDEGSELDAFGRANGVREVFRNRTDIGGRYAALSYFGLVPAALAGFDWEALVDRAQAVASSLRDPDPAVNAGLWLGALLGAGVRAGRDKLTFVLDPALGSFGLWLEQLIAESTGKAGTGVVPVVGEPLGPVDVYGEDRIFVSIGDPVHPAALEVLAQAGHPVVEMPFGELADLGSQVLTWEVATAICGAVLEVNPFDQPNVAEAKTATSEVLEADAGQRPEVPTVAPAAVLDLVVPGDYLSLQAYVAPGSQTVSDLEEVRLRLRDRLKVATTLGLGPRFLHSTGQLHKGGAPTGVFLQIVGDDDDDIAIPGRPFTFGELKQAQADGDLATLHRHGLRAARVTIDDLREVGRGSA